MFWNLDSEHYSPSLYYYKAIKIFYLVILYKNNEFRSQIFYSPFKRIQSVLHLLAKKNQWTFLWKDISMSVYIFLLADLHCNEKVSGIASEKIPTIILSRWNFSFYPLWGKKNILPYNKRKKSGKCDKLCIFVLIAPRSEKTCFYFIIILTVKWKSGTVLVALSLSLSLSLYLFLVFLT